MNILRALDQGELRVHLQPVVALPSRQVTGFEALVRWQHPERGLLRPDSFLELSDSVGLVSRIDRWMVEAVVDLLAECAHRRPVAVNLAGATFADAELVAWLRCALLRREIPPGLVEVELDESTLMARPALTARHLADLADLGVKVWLDETGVGSTPVVCMQSHAVDGVKLHHELIGRLTSDDRTVRRVASMMRVADALGMVVMAEGVETDSQLQLLADLRAACDRLELRAQGALFGAPADGAERLDGFVPIATDPIGVPASG